MEVKEEENKNNDNDCFNLGKNTHIEVYDYSGRKLNLSTCKEDITVMKYIGDVTELNIESAKSLSTQGIDVFNAEDDFFNDICHPFDNPNGTDKTGEMIFIKMFLFVKMDAPIQELIMI